MRKEYEKLELFNYSPVPFLDLHKRQFLPIRRLQNSGDLYEGQWGETSGKRDGFGYCISIEAEYLYEGYWVAGVQQGRGRMIMPNGYYEGDFSGNQRHGFGIYVWTSSGDYYEGNWYSGIKSGQGKLYTKKEDKFYEGEFKNNKKHGEGKIIASDGVTVLERGTWNNDVK